MNRSWIVGACVCLLLCGATFAQEGEGQGNGFGGNSSSGQISQLRESGIATQSLASATTWGAIQTPLDLALSPGDSTSADTLFFNRNLGGLDQNLDQRSIVYTQAGNLPGAENLFSAGITRHTEGGGVWTAMLMRSSESFEFNDIDENDEETSDFNSFNFVYARETSGGNVIGGSISYMQSSFEENDRFSSGGTFDFEDFTNESTFINLRGDYKLNREDSNILFSVLIGLNDFENTFDERQDFGGGLDIDRGGDETSRDDIAFNVRYTKYRTDNLQYQFHGGFGLREGSLDENVTFFSSDAGGTNSTVITDDDLTSFNINFGGYVLFRPHERVDVTTGSSINYWDTEAELAGSNLTDGTATTDFIDNTSSELLSCNFKSVFRFFVTDDLALIATGEYVQSTDERETAFGSAAAGGGVTPTRQETESTNDDTIVSLGLQYQIDDRMRLEAAWFDSSNGLNFINGGGNGTPIITNSNGVNTVDLDTVAVSAFFTF